MQWVWGLPVRKWVIPAVVSLVSSLHVAEEKADVHWCTKTQDKMTFFMPRFPPVYFLWWLLEKWPKQLENNLMFPWFNRPWAAADGMMGRIQPSAEMHRAVDESVEAFPTSGFGRAVAGPPHRAETSLSFPDY